MTISRRSAIGCASALAFSGSTLQFSLAGAAKHAVAKLAPARASGGQSAQRFLELLIHEDEAGGTEYSSMIWIAAPDTAWRAMSSLSTTAYEMNNMAYKKRGYRLRRVSAFDTKAGVRYAACWELASGPDWHSRHGMSPAAFASACAEFSAGGYRMTHVDARVGYAAIWEKGDPASQQIVTALAPPDFDAQSASLAAQGFRPVRTSIAGDNGSSRFTSIFEKSSGGTWQASSQLALAQLRKIETAMMAKGFRMTDASGRMIAGKPLFSGIWEKA
jgi:hypothetical protein